MCDFAIFEGFNFFDFLKLISEIFYESQTFSETVLILVIRAGFGAEVVFEYKELVFRKYIYMSCFLINSIN